MTKVTDDKVYRVGSIEVSPQHNVVSRGDHSVSLQPKVMAVLDYLANHSERVISNEELLEHVWQGRVVTHSSIQKSINALRAALSKLDSDREYVVHFSKRGYQLDVPVETNSAPIKVLSSPFRSGKSVAVSVTLLVAGLIVMVGLYQMYTPSPQSTKVIQSDLNVEDFWSNDAGKDHLPEPHVTTGRVAFTRTISRDGDELNQLFIRDRQGREWDVSAARGEFVDIAWSSSGRNLVALEVHSASGRARQPDFYAAPNDYHSFHIYTLDFKGARLLEKNILSHWLGSVRSVTWVDEVTLEFVASQLPSIALHRYRYLIPEQRLTKLAPLTPSSMPLLSRIQGSRTLLLQRDESGEKVVLLDQDQNPQQQWQFDAIGDLSWLPDESGFIVLGDSKTQPRMIGLRGVEQRLSWPPGFDPSVQRLRPLGEEALLVENHRVSHPEWFRRSVQPAQVAKLPAPSSSRYLFFSPIDGGIFSVAKNAGQWYLSRFREGEFGGGVKMGISGDIDAINKAGRADLLLFGHSGQVGAYNVGAYNLVSGDYSELMLNVRGFAPLDYDVDRKVLWGVKVDDGQRYIWRHDLSDRTAQQMTFAAVGTVFASASGLYFQYISQPGVWLLDFAKGQIEPQSRTLPANSKIIYASDQTIYFVSGGRCRESGVSKLDLSTGHTTRELERPSSALTTIDFHPDYGLLEHGCRPDRTDIVKFSF